MSLLSELIRSERLALVKDLETLTPEQWATPSLCRGWTVQDVAAHIAWAPVLPPWEAVPGLARARFSMNAFIASSAVRWSARGVPAILDQLWDNAATGARPFGLPESSALVDAVVHAMDIRRPLDRHRAIPKAAMAPAASFLLGVSSLWPLSDVVGGSARKRVAGLRLVASEVDWAYGEGAEVHASPETMLLVLSGRPVSSRELTGPGAAQLASRL